MNAVEKVIFVLLFAAMTVAMTLPTVEFFLREEESTVDMTEEHYAVIDGHIDLDAAAEAAQLAWVVIDKEGS